jgi:drug/metabolite transporter (DMT)-like permease
MSKILIALYVLATSFALIALKLATKDGSPFSYVDGRAHFNLNAYTLTGLTLYGISFVLYTFLIAKYDLGYIIPLATGLVYVMIFTASYFIFKEVFTPIKIIGIFLIIGGVIVLNLNK